MQVHEYMMVNPIAVSPKTKYAEAIRLLRLKKLAALPIVGKEGQLVGIVTERDLLDISPVAVLGTHTISHLLSVIAVEEAMTRQVITVQEDCPLEEAARMLIDNKIGSLPVMRGDQLVGMITEADIFQAMTAALGGGAEGLRVTIRLTEDKGELGAITDGIVQLGGKLVSLSTYWGDDPFKRVITLKVQEVNREELLMMLEWTIGVPVIDFCESRVEPLPVAISPARNTETFSNQNPDAKIPWLLDSK
ncbi:MAG TPA: CBS domain-containing protein [Anaerolineales bacterium]|nr:CBS domain-containing protein [Anaerolineales bacterium]